MKTKSLFLAIFAISIFSCNTKTVEDFSNWTGEENNSCKVEHVGAPTGGKAMMIRSVDGTRGVFNWEISDNNSIDMVINFDRAFQGGELSLMSDTTIAYRFEVDYNGHITALKSHNRIDTGITLPTDLWQKLSLEWDEELLSIYINGNLLNKKIERWNNSPSPLNINNLRIESTADSIDNYGILLDLIGTMPKD